MMQDKDKDKSKLKNPHQFVPVCHSNSQPCDVCSKSLTNKAALRCESKLLMNCLCFVKLVCTASCLV